MPSSVKTRPTTDHEYIFFFSNEKDYYYDADAIREPHVTFSENSKMKGGRNHFGKRGGTPETGKNSGDNNLHDGRWDKRSTLKAATNGPCGRLRLSLIHI